MSKVGSNPKNYEVTDDTAKIGISCQISRYGLDRSSLNFSIVRYMQGINKVTFVLCPFDGPCYGNQLILETICRRRNFILLIYLIIKAEGHTGHLHCSKIYT